MKIFNWVHKKFQHKVLNDEVAGNEENTDLKSTTTTTDKDTQAFLRQLSLVAEVDHGWRDGILTIGTFGFDPLKPFNNQSDYKVLEREEDGKEGKENTYGGDHDEDTTTHDNIEYEELNPLMFTTFGHSYEDTVSNSDAMNVESDVILGIHSTKSEGCNEITVEPDLDSESDRGKQKGDRITLADLFMADGHRDVQSEIESPEVKPELIKKKMKTKTRNGGLAFAKKLIPLVKEDSTPIKNVQRLMRRMLKRKIHPTDLDVKKPTAAAVELTSATVETDAFDSVSLLPIQGATSVH